MKGITLYTDPNGLDIVMIDRANLDPQYSPLVEGLLNLIQRSEEDTERADFRAAAHAALNRAYGDDEPDYDDEPEYTDANLIEKNPNYKPKTI